MEAAHQRVAERSRNAERGGQEFGEARVKRGREGQAGAPAVRACREAERPFGGDMDRVRQASREPALHLGAGAPGELDLGIAGAAQARKERRLDHHHLVPARSQALAEIEQRRDHAVDLRRPRVGDDRDPHATTAPASASASAAPGRAPRAAGARVDQSMISSRPSACSASAVRLSTQSPSLA